MIVIAGAGIGGLSLAAALRRAGRPFTVLERAPQLVPVGAGITLSPNAMAALEHLQLDKAIRAVARELAGGAICDRRGRVLLPVGDYEGRGKRVRYVGPAPTQPGEVGPTFALSRTDLQLVLLDGAGPGAVETGCEVTGYTPHAGGVTVSLASGRVIEAELLVGADGLRSAVRRGMRGDEPLRYAGTTSWRALVDDVDLSAGCGPERFSESWGPGSRFGIVPLGPRRAYWFAVADAPAGQIDPPDPRPMLHARFAAWHAPIDRLIAATDPAHIYRTDIVDRPPIDSWVHDRVALLGDAAHPMTPNLGQGGGQAIEDAVVLADALVREPTVAGALGRYESQRLRRANRFVVRSQRLGQLAHVHGAPLLWLRDRALRLIPPKLANRSLARELTFHI
jgi:2-polyprenyl-6-methoxyphenol hydroxylase-like FAD-dependent oxidoreductase